MHAWKTKISAKGYQVYLHPSTSRWPLHNLSPLFPPRIIDSCKITPAVDHVNPLNSTAPKFFGKVSFLVTRRCQPRQILPPHPHPLSFARFSPSKQAESTRMVARGQAPAEGQTFVQPLDAPPPLVPVAAPAATAGGRSGTGILRDSASSLSFPAPPAEQQLSPISTLLLAHATGADDHDGRCGDSRLRPPHQQQQQQRLVDIDKTRPISQQALHEDRLGRQQQQKTTTSSAGEDKHRSSRIHRGQGAPVTAMAEPPGPTPMTMTAATSALLRRRHTSPPPVGALSPDSRDAAAVASAAGERALSAVLVPPRAAARRVAVAVSHGPERERSRRDRSKVLGGGLGGPERVVLRRRVSVGSGGTPTSAAAVAGVDRGARGFDATPYRTTVHFRDR